MTPSTVLRPAARARRIAPWMALGVVALLAGLWAALVLLGLPVPHTPLPLAAAHGPLMALAFLGTLIGAERAVALGRWWGFLTPAAAGLGGAATIVGAPYALGPALLTVAGVALVVVFAALYRIQPSVHTAVMAAGAACWPVAAGLWLAGWDVARFVPWLAGFLVLTIAGERLELARLALLSVGARRVFVALTVGLLAALTVSLWAETSGVRLAGAALLGVAAWLLLRDVARRTVRVPGLTRYMAVALLAGYVWLAAGGVLWLVVGRMAGGSAYDAMLHAIFLGFVISMVFAHAPVIVPALLGVRLPYRHVFLVHLVLLHASLVVRLVGGDLLGSRLAWQVGGVLGEVALLLFVVVTVLTVVRNRRGVVRPVSDAAGPPGVWGRADWHLVANGVVVAYLLAALTALPLHAVGGAPRWLVVHLFALGAATNAIVVWSRHFTVTLLHLPADRPRVAGRQLGVLNAAVVGVLVGVVTGQRVLTVVAAVVLAAVVGWHLLGLVRAGRRALGGRFTPVVGFYRAAAVALLAGIGLGSALAVGVPPAWEPRLYAAHVHLNLLGWVALTILGTQFTLWPTILRTRMVEGIMRTARRTLVLTVTGLTVLLVGLLLAVPAVAAVGLGAYAAGVLLALDPFVRTARQKLPRSPAAWMVAAGTAWLVVALGVDLGGQVFTALTAPEPSSGAATSVGRVVPVLLAGFVGQVLLGALSYLVPVVLGRGPRDGRRLSEVLDRLGAVRVAALNAGIVLVALPFGGPVELAGWVLVGAAALAFVALVLTALFRRTPASPPDGPRGTDLAAGGGTGRRAGRLAVVGGLGIGLVLLLVGVGVAQSGRHPVSTAASVSGNAGSQVGATRAGVRTVQVTLENMDITPGTVTVARGTHLVLQVVNRDPMRHDLSFPDGPHTRMLQSGEGQRLDLGRVTTSLEGWCTVPGHRQAGMVLDVEVRGAPASGSSGHDMAGMSMGGASSRPTSRGPDATIDPGARPPASFEPRDADLPPVAPGRVHHVTLRAVDKVLEVAPGVRQRMWTFNGMVPGPTLHGRVGDTFVVTLRNESTMGHSIDFHASQVAPDRVMRTIPPGGELTYRFTADHAGAWMYHCATMPMIQHIGNGMYGAVVIDPPNLPRVDHEWVLVQSELYLGPQGRHGDFAKMARGRPDAVVFNGYYDQYDFAPLRARSGDRVRIWVVNDGMERPLAFHVVGTQFDTVFKEGAYQLRRGNAQHGAAQALDLLPAQGGFVELRLPGPGHYPLLNHVMVDAARGAHGSITVTR